MSNTPEGQLKFKIKGYLNELGPNCFWFMPMMNGFGKSGIPDFVVCFRGRYVTIEVKVHGRKPKPWQELRGQEITLAGGLHVVAYTIDEVRIVFEPIRKTKTAF